MECRPFFYAGKSHELVKKGSVRSLEQITFDFL